MEREGFDVFETLCNDWALQGRWASEHAQRVIFEPNWQFKILLEQVRVFQPDVIFIYAGALTLVQRVQREQLRAVSGPRAIVTGFWGDELPVQTTYSEYFGDLDYAFCSSSRYERHFKAANIPASTIGNSFDDSISFRAPSKKTRDLIFCGTTGYGYADHIGRYQKLVELMKRTGLQIWANESTTTDSKSVKEFILNTLARTPSGILRILGSIQDRRVRRAVEVSLTLKETDLDASSFFKAILNRHPNAGFFSQAKPLRKLFRSRVHKQLMNCSDYYRLLAESKLVLNLHRDEDADIGNIRCFEVTGVGSCLITDRGRELSEFFDAENDIVTFGTVDECVEKVNYLLQHPTEIDRIARNGQRTTLSHHTVTHRCQVISAKLKKLLAESGSARRPPRTVVATYDIEKHPISYDFAFFLQAAEIFRKLSRADQLVVEILRPADIENMAGVSKEANIAVDAHGREFRIFHICIQLTELMQLSAVVNIKNRATLGMFENSSDTDSVASPLRK